MEASEDSAYGEAVAIYTITMLMHYYSMSREEVWSKTPSEINTLLEMIGYIKNPQLLQKYKSLKFDSEFEFDQYILNKMKFV